MSKIGLNTYEKAEILTSAFVLVFLFMSCRNYKASIDTRSEAGTTAIPCIHFLNSIGVNSAVSRRGESLQKTIEISKYLGVRWVRLGYEGGLPVSDLINLHAATRMRFSYGLLSGGTNIPLLIDNAKQLAAVGALLAVEVLNEPNNWGINYKGKQGGKNLTWMPVAALQRDLYQSVKNDAVLSQYPVWSLSENGAETDNVGLQFLKIPQGSSLLMPDDTRYADYANCHNYFMHPSHPGLYDNQTWNAADPTKSSKVDGLFGNNGTTWKSHFKGYTEKELLALPRVTTETGAVLAGELTEEKQARLFMNLFLAQFARGWSYTALYLLRDRSDEQGNQQFGFYKADYTPRKAAIYFHNFTTILNDIEAVKAPGKLNYSVMNKPETVHDLLLQKSNGQFELVLWDERVKGTDDVTVNFGKRLKMIKVYEPVVGTSVIRSLKNASEVQLTLSDHPIILEIDKPY